MTNETEKISKNSDGLVDAADLPQPTWADIQNAYMNGALSGTRHVEATTEEWWRAADAFCKALFLEKDAELFYRFNQIRPPQVPLPKNCVESMAYGDCTDQTVVNLDTEIDLINKTIAASNELETKFILSALRDEYLNLHKITLISAAYAKDTVDKLTAENEYLLTDNGHLHHDYHHLKQMVKDLLEAVDKISPDVEGYFEPCNEELCELRDWIDDMM